MKILSIAKKYAELTRFAYTNNKHETLYENEVFRITGYLTEGIKLLYFSDKHSQYELRTAIDANNPKYLSVEFADYTDTLDSEWHNLSDFLESDVVYNEVAKSVAMFTEKSIKEELTQLKEENAQRLLNVQNKHLKITKQLTA